MKIPVVPYLTPPTEAVGHDGWNVRFADGDSPLPTDLPHWDYQTTLELSAAVSVDRRTVVEACELRGDSGLAVLVTAHSSHTGAEIPVVLLDVPVQDSYDLAIRVELPGERLGGRLALRTFLVVTDPKPLSDLAASDHGSILWRAEHKTHLEGIGSQFPTDAADFSLSRPEDAGAAWLLEVDMSNLDALFMSAVRLTLNSGNDSVRALLEGHTDPATDLLRRTLRWDVTRQLVQHALSADEILAAEFDPESGSVLAVLRNLISSVWPGTSPIIVKDWHAADPSRVERRIQSHCGLV